MFRSTPAVVFAALLLVAQLLSGVMPAGAVPNAVHCADCPGATSQHVMTHDATSPDDGDCASHCNHGGHSGHAGGVTGQAAGCGTGCAMVGSGRCSGFSMNPALAVALLLAPAIATGSFGSHRHAVILPDSPLFDFLRPPNRA